MSLGEFELIEQIRARAPRVTPEIVVGIGDDAAVLQSPGTPTLVATDMLMEGVHFTFPPATPQLAGRKSLAVNLSDLAAMAARPTAAFVAISVPQVRGAAFASDVMDGVRMLADEFDVPIAGGDTNSWNGPLVVCVTVVGTCAAPVRRDGAQVGDWILVTGALGGSLRGHHLQFTPRIREALELVDRTTVHAMIDVSDGLGADLGHLLDESDVGATLRASEIPIRDAARRDATPETALQRSLGDGEDFELLFTLAADDGQRLVAEQPFSVPVSHIGQIEQAGVEHLQLSDGRLVALPRRGWKHNLDAP